MSTDWGAAVHLAMQVATEQMVPEGWRVDVRSARVVGTDAYVYEFTFTKTAVGTSHISGMDVAKLQGVEDATALAERVIGEAMAEAGLEPRP